MPKKFTDLAELSALDDADVLAVVDTSANTSKKITLQTLRQLITPAGVIQAYGGSSAPQGWLICDGSAVSRTTYAALYAAIGTAFGAGDGSTTFNLPNAKGRMLVGRDAAQTIFDTLGETGGQTTVMAHTHPNRWRAFMPSGTGSLAINDRGGDALLISDNASHGSNGENLSGDPSIANTAGSGVNNMNPYQVVNYIIKT